MFWPNFTVKSMQLRTLAVYDRLLGTVLERRFRRGPQPAGFRGCFPRENLDLRYYLSNSELRWIWRHVRFDGFRCQRPCNNRWRLQHTSSNESRA